LTHLQQLRPSAAGSERQAKRPKTDFDESSRIIILLVFARPRDGVTDAIKRRVPVIKLS
jgi:hypothetical protein